MSRTEPKREDVPLPPHEQDALAFRQSVKRLRKLKGWTQNQLATELRKAGIAEFTQVAVARLERGERSVKIGEAGVIANVLGATIQNMLIPSTSIEKEIRNIESSLSIMNSFITEAGLFIYRYEILRASVISSLEEIDRRVSSGEGTSHERQLLDGTLTALIERPGLPGAHLPHRGIMSSSWDVLNSGIHAQIFSETDTGKILAIRGEETTSADLFTDLATRAEKVLKSLGVWNHAYYEAYPDEQEEELAHLYEEYYQQADLEEGED